MFVKWGQRPFSTRSILEGLLARTVGFWEECLCCLVELWRWGRTKQHSEWKQLILRFYRQHQKYNLIGWVHFFFELRRRITSVVGGVWDERAAQRAGCVWWPVPGKCAKARLTEDVTARLTAVRAVVDVETHGAGEAFSVLLLTVQQWTSHTPSLDTAEGKWLPGYTSNSKGECMDKI